MPRRWLSVRGRREEQDHKPTADKPGHQHGFDFAFTTEPELLGQYRQSQVTELRPMTSGGERYRTNRKPDLTLLIERPKSSDSVLHKTPHSAQLDDSQIGLAFGSPRHPPREFASFASTMSPTQQQHAFCLQGPLPTRQVKGRRWKLGSLFKPKPTLTKENFYQVQLSGSDANKLGLPIQRNPWRNPKSPVAPQNGFHSPLTVPNEGDAALSSFKSSDQASDAALLAAGTPSLQVSIPGTPLERYSVMFKDVNGVKQSGLLIRRSKGLDQLVIAEEARSANSDLTVPKIRRPASSPTFSTHQDGQKFPVHFANSSKYSLFPSTPTSIKSQNQSESPQLCRTRSATAPCSQSSSTQDTTRNNTTCTKTEQTESTLPVTCKKSTDSKAANIQPPSDASRSSSQSEIFFEIKSFRDSSGQVGQHFEMTRPPSAAVQLARSKSNARRMQQKQCPPQAEPTEPESLDDRNVKTTSVQIDETIAIVESLTSPSMHRLRDTEVLQTRQMHPTDTDAGLADMSCKQAAIALETTETIPIQGRRKNSLKSKVDGLNISVPSPVLESSEEFSPKNLLPISIPPSPQSPPRPSVPVKDSKYIPLSKYAPKHTTEDLVRQTGLRPVRPMRSNTDTIPHIPRSSSFQRPAHPTRASTIPNPATTRTSNVPQSRYASASPVTDNAAATGRDSAIVPGPTMVAFVKPAAEVSIARTISLSRKPSTKVTVARPAPPPLSRSESKRIKEEVMDKKKEVGSGIAVVQEVAKRHKPGLSLDVVLETAASAPGSPAPPMPCKSPPAVPLRQAVQCA